MKRLMRWLSAAAIFTFALAPAGADQNDPRLDGLFLQLKSARSQAEARVIEEAVWRIWAVSGNEAADRQMARGVLAMHGGDHAEALAAFDRIVKIAPGFAEGWNKRATVHYLMGNHAASIHDIGKTLALEPRHFGALSGLGLVNLALGNEKAALEAFEAALEIQPHLPGANTRIKALRDKVRGKRI